MNYHNITKDDMINGDGIRVVLWVAGCSHHCEGCHNQFTWDKNQGVLFTEDTKKELFDELKKDYVSGITFSGGDPLMCDNREEIGKLIEEIAQKFPTKTIWLYTGFLWNDVKELPYIKNVDVLVDGRFVKDLYDSQLHWKGSSNQNVIDVKESLKQGAMVLHNS